MLRYRERETVCKLKKSLYGLHIGRQLHGSISNQRRTTCKNEKLVLVLVFVEASDRVNHTKNEYTQKFQINDLGQISYCLGIQVEKKQELSPCTWIVRQIQNVMMMMMSYLTVFTRPDIAHVRTLEGTSITVMVKSIGWRQYTSFRLRLTVQKNLFRAFSLAELRKFSLPTYIEIHDELKWKTKSCI